MSTGRSERSRHSALGGHGGRRDRDGMHQEAPWRSWLAAFDQLAETYDEATRDPWFAYDRAWSFVDRSLREALGGLAGRRIVDVGCGTGAFLGRLADAGAIGIGVEPSAGMRAAAAQRLPDTSIVDGHLAAVPLPDTSVDAAIATYVVSHLAPEEQPAAIAELLRVVRGVGPILVVDVPIADASAIPAYRRALRAAGRAGQIEWYERGFGLDLEAWRAALATSGRAVVTEPLGPLLLGVAALPDGRG